MAHVFPIVGFIGLQIQPVRPAQNIRLYPQVPATGLGQQVESTRREGLERVRDAGMRAIVYMDVFEMTTGTAWIVSRVVPDFKVFGGIIMNTVYGGMNPRSVKTAIFYGSGARYVSFGAHSTKYQASKEGRVVDGKFSPLKDLYPRFVEEELSRCIEIPLEGKPGPELEEILEMIAAKPHIILNTSHVSPAEAFRLIDLAKQYGIKKVLLANSVVANLSIAEMKRAAGSGAYLERTLAAHTHTTTIPKTHYYVEPEWRARDEGLPGAVTGGLKMIAEQIQEVGPKHFVLNQLTGAIPPGIGTLPNLSYLKLGWNQLTGAIPLSIANLAKLEVLFLDYNQLTGSIPNAFASPLVRVLFLGGNQLTGSIPASLWNLTEMRYLSLGPNTLSGPIPAELGNLTQLLWLYLHWNALTGPIPPSLGNLSSLQRLGLDANQLSGSIPPSLGNLSSLLTLVLGGNQLTGTIRRASSIPR